jgi:hypothetical protein
MRSTGGSPYRNFHRQVTIGLFRALLVGLVTVGWSQTGMAQTPAPVDNRVAKERGCRDGPNPLLKISPEWVSVEASDLPRAVEGLVRASHIATGDLPTAHVSHDWNADLLLDPAYNHFNSDANERVPPTVDGEQRMEVEWESKFFPPPFWPAPGDRAWMLGRWIFDCGHPPYRTEIHPPRAVAFTRPEPIIFPGDTRPSQSNLTHVYIHGRGGYYQRRVEDRNYDFDVPLPPRPAQPSTLRTTVLSLPFGGPSPTLALVSNSEPPRLHVSYRLAGVPDPTNTRQFGAVFAAAWQTTAINPNEPSYRLLRVTFDSIKINTDHDPLPFDSGEWRLWLRARGEWFEVGGLSDVNDGDTVAINRSVELIVPDNGTFEIQTSGWENDCDGDFRTKDSDISSSPTLDDLSCELNGNDNIGILERRYAKVDGFGIGSHRDASVANGDDGDTLRDFELRYHVELVRFFEPPSTHPGSSAGSLQVTLSGVTRNTAFPVQVTGPGFSQNLTQTATLTGLAPGLYQITANEFTTGQGNRQTCRVFTPITESTPATVTGNQTSNVEIAFTSALCDFQPTPPPVRPTPPPVQPTPPPVQPTPPPNTTIAVPDVTGSSQSSALAALRAVGLNPGNIQPIFDCNNPGVVTSQSPRGGTQVAAGTSVNLVVGSSRDPSNPRRVCP